MERKSTPPLLRGEGKGGGEGPRSIPKDYKKACLPLTLTLSPKGRRESERIVTKEALWIAC
jgi:hypothetical protein